jgi:acetyl-CoA acetyltransferase
MRNVAVLGVGMHRFGIWPEASNAAMGLQAGRLALQDAGLSFREIQAAYGGHIFAQTMSVVRALKEFGLTGIPVQRVENASATGSAAFREACLAVASGRHEVVMALGCRRRSLPCGPRGVCTSVACNPSTSLASAPRTSTTAP